MTGKGLSKSEGSDFRMRYCGRLMHIAIVMIIVMLFAGASCVSSYAQGEQPKDKKGERHFPPRDKGEGKFGELNLTPEQQAGLKKIREKYDTRREDLLFLMREKKLEMVKMLKEDKPDRKKLERKLEEITKLEADRQRLFLDEFFEVREILTPKQAKIFTRKTMKFLLRD